MWLALSLAIFLGIFMAEGAVHSVHHADHRDAAKCSVNAVTQHAPADCPDLPSLGAPLTPFKPLPVEPASSRLLSAPFDPYHGRAPPSLPR